MTDAPRTNPLTTFVIIAVINAVVQTLLIVPQPIFGLNTPLFLVLAAISTVSILLATAAILGTILSIGERPLSLRNSARRIRPRAWLFLGWTLLWLVLIVAGLLIWIIPGLIVAAVLPFVGIAIADGNTRPFVANLHAIQVNVGAFIGALAATFVVLFFLYLIGAGLAFLLPGVLAAFLTWIYVGLIGAWIIRGWVRLYRRAMERLDLIPQRPHG
jgi:MFS family permease